MTSRKCSNWISTFVDWTKPKSQAPASCLLWTALFTISATLRKQVRIPAKKYLGSWDCYPNLYVVLVGDPGVINKSTTMGFGDELLRMLPEIPASPTEISKAALIQEMAESGGSLYITAGELSQIISRSKMDMYDYLTVCYDTNKPLRGRTIMGGKTEILDPCLNLFACTQPVWITENMPASVIGGGFTSRTIMLLEREPRTVNLFYTHLDHVALDKIKARLVEDLIKISQLSGEFSLTDEAVEFAEAWFRRTHLERNKIHPNVKPFFARRHVHVLKVASIFNVSYSDELNICKTDIEFAIGQFEYVLKKVESLFKSIGKNEYNADNINILDYIRMHEKVAKTVLLREFSAVATFDKLTNLLDGLTIMQYIKVTRDDNDELFYEVVK